LVRESLNLLINSSLIPDPSLLAALHALPPGTGLMAGEYFLAACLEGDKLPGSYDDEPAVGRQINYTGDYLSISYPWDLFRMNGELIRKDFELITSDRRSSAISSTNNLLGREQIFAEDGASLEYVTLNASTGPIYLGRHTEIMEGTVIRGPFALCDHSTVKLNAKIYGPTTIGPASKAGGEINNSVILGYSNKAHDGFLGNSVLGEWCNIGADSNNSNLKNNYSDVRLWNYTRETFIRTGLQFCGLIMGDHTKCGINTMFNTGTVVGVSANIFGPGFPRNFIPSFSWGGPAGFSTYAMDKAFEVASLVMLRRGIVFDDIEQKILETVFLMTAKYRK
jgi:UDP-N-acetylglucosamine diphosphorylase/glucosamine-1-phosphate N-acetyltransferase